ncbi:MAG: ATP-dependent helicase [Spirochaetales bacterium]|nr:ATP-dependent helicase [Spirochaetales bacterium]
MSCLYPEHEPVVFLNQQQQDIVSCLDSHQIVVAGPGTGKTRTMVHWIHHIIDSKKALAHEILAVTFTHKAADELTNRVKKMSGPTWGQVMIETFHSIVYSWVEKHCGQDMKILDNLKRYRLIEALNPDLSARQAAQMAREMNLFYGRSQALSVQFQHAFEKYRSYLDKTKQLDLSEMITWFCDYLESHDTILMELRLSIKYLAVDELQDIDQSQYRLIKLLCQENGPILLAIGDPDQGIYGFRGADISHFFNLIKDFSLKPKVLNLNYRSENDILKAASSLIAWNRERLEIFPEATKKGPPGNICLFEAFDDEDEGRFIAKTIETLVGGIDLTSRGLGGESNLCFSDMAVLYRKRQTGRQLFRILSKYQIPVSPVDDAPFLLQDPFRDIYLKLSFLADPLDGAAFYEIFYRDYEIIKQEDIVNLLVMGLSCERSLEWVKKYVRPEKIEDFIKLEDELDKYKKDLENIDLEYVLSTMLSSLDDQQYPMASLVKKELLAQVRFYKNDLKAFLKRILLSPFESVVKFHQDRLSLLTYHSAKGLEFPVVFLPGLEKGTVPLSRSLNREEERRLFYVALTRAQNKVYISWAKKRLLWGCEKKSEKSCFLDEIPMDFFKKIIFSVNKPYFQPTLF